MERLLSALLSVLILAACAVPAAASSLLQPAICPKPPETMMASTDLAADRFGQDTIVISPTENPDCGWHGVFLGDRKAYVTEKLAPEFPLLYELSAIGNMNLYGDKEVLDHYLTVYFDDSDRVSMIVWQINSTASIDV